MVGPTEIELLLVEDNPGDADLIEAYLETHPYLTTTIRHVETLAEARAFLEDGAPDLCLLDLTLPDSSGLDTLSAVREMAPRLPVVLLTGAKVRDMEWEAIREGADDFLAKDELAPEPLARAIRYALDRAAIMDRLRRRDAILESVSLAAGNLLLSGELDEVIDTVLGTLGRATGVGKVDLWTLRSETEQEIEPELLHRWTAPEYTIPEDQRETVVPDGLDWLDRLRRGEAVRAGSSSGPYADILAELGIVDAVLLPVQVRDRFWGCLRFVSREGGREWSELEVEALRAAAAILGAAVQRREDREQLRQRDQQLAQVQKLEAVGRLAGGIAHDFNNLLTAVNGYAQVLEEGVGEDPDLQAAVQEITRAADRGGRLTNQLLAFSKQKVLERSVVEPGPTVKELEPLLRRLIGEHIDLDLRASDDNAPVYIDRSQFEQILMNLVLNSRDALQDGGRIEIRTDAVQVSGDDAGQESAPGPGRYARLSVRDDGCGMDEETRTHVFEPFFTTKPPDKGTGLGLATVYGVVDEVGGYVELTSSPGEGTEVTILLPVTARAPESEVAQEVGATRAARNETVLVVEDEEAVRMVAVRCLSRAGYRVLEAGDGREALRIVETADAPVDVLLTDVVMPHMGGTALAGQLRERYPGIRVILTSGYTQDELVQQGIDRDEVVFLPKPYTPKDLTAKVATALSV